MNKMPKTLGDAFLQDLAGWQLAKVYFLQLKHGLMGFFPAKVASTGGVVLCMDEKLLARMAEHLTPRQYVKSDVYMIVHVEQGIGFSLNDAGTTNLDREAMPVLTEATFDRLVAEAGEKSPFKWAPGLVGDDMNAEEFRETLQGAAAQT